VGIESRYRGRDITSDDVALIRQLIVDHPRLSRRALSMKLCEAWRWFQPNGTPRDMVARSLLLHLHRAGLIELPVQKRFPPNNVVRHHRPEPSLLLAWPDFEGPLARIRPVEIRQVRRTGEEGIFNSFIQTYHYLGYTRPVGEHLKYLVCAQGVPVACMAWSSAPRHIGPRDQFIGWSAETRRRHVHLVAYNTRFLILPWARMPHLASHVLAQVAHRISADWNQLYGHPIWLLETFVDPERFRGTCYRAANWIRVGITTGRGKNDQTHVPNRSLKDVLVYPLARDFRKRLGVS
jgi:uncharacterized protein DUF4338